MLELNDRRGRVHNGDAPLKAVVGKGKARRIAQGIDAESARVHRAERLHGKVFLCLAEEPAARHRVGAGVLKVRTVLDRHVVVAVNVKTHRAPVDEQDGRRRKGQPYKDRQGDQQAVSSAFSICPFLCLSHAVSFSVSESVFFIIHIF